MTTLIDHQKQQLELNKLLFWSVQVPRLGGYLPVLAALLAGLAAASLLGLSLIWQPTGEIVRILAAVAGISAILYVALAVDTDQRRVAVVYLLSGVLAFSLALMAINGSILWLAGAFLAHLGWAAFELWRQPGSSPKHWLVLSWAGFNLGNMMLLMLGR